MWGIAGGGRVVDNGQLKLYISPLHSHSSVPSPMIVDCKGDNSIKTMDFPRQPLSIARLLLSVCLPPHPHPLFNLHFIGSKGIFRSPFIIASKIASPDNPPPTVTNDSNSESFRLHSPGASIHPIYQHWFYSWRKLPNRFYSFLCPFVRHYPFAWVPVAVFRLYCINIKCYNLCEKVWFLQVVIRESVVEFSRIWRHGLNGGALRDAKLRCTT